MRLDTQAKFLGAIETGEIERLGGTRTIQVDARIVAATNKNLTEEIQAGRFREDLFYRLSVVPIHVQPLRARREDIPLLIRHFMEGFGHEHGRPRRKLEPGDGILNRDDPSYAGSFYIFGHGGCFGDVGHCDVPTSRDSWASASRRAW